MRVDKYIMHTMNKRNVINTIRTQGPINKSEIAKRIGLSIPTVLKITDEFIENKLIRVNGKGKSKGGKRPDLLEFVNDAYYIVGVDIGRNKIKVIVSDLNGNEISKRIIVTGADVSPERTINRIIKLIEDTINDSGIDISKFLGLGIGMPGLLDIEKGIVIFSPTFHWENVNLLEPIRKHFPMYITLENSNKTQAMGEKWFGIGVETDYFISVNLGHGIGSAIVENGELYSSSCGTNGEFGHITLEKDGPRCDCGNDGCLEALASGNAITKQAKELIKSGNADYLLKLVNGNIDDLNAKTVFDAAKQGDIVSEGIINSAIEYIGIGLASYINLLDPDTVILSGGLTNAGDILVDGLNEVMHKRRMRYAGRKVKLCVAKLGDDGTALGASTLVLKAFIEQGGNPELV